MGIVFWLIIGIAAVKIPLWIVYRILLHRAGYRFHTVYDWRGRRRTIRYHIDD